MEDPTEIIASLTKQRDETNSLLTMQSKEKSQIERELRNAQGIINKSKEIRALKYALEESSQLRNELELLGDQKFQNDALKDSIHSMIVKSDMEKGRSSKLIEILRKQLTTAGLIPEPEPALSDEQHAEVTSSLEQNALTASKVLVLEAKTTAMEKSHNEWKIEKARMQKVIGTLKLEIEEFRLQAERKDEVPANPLNSSTPESKSASSWFKGFAATNSSVSMGTGAAAAVPAPGPATSGSLQAGVSSESMPHEEKSASVVSGSEKSATTITAAPAIVITVNPTNTTTATANVAAAARSWWNKSAATNATTAATTSPSSSSPPNSSAPGDQEKLKALEAELETLRKEVKELRQKTDLPLLPIKQVSDLKADLNLQQEANKNEAEMIKNLEGQLADALATSNTSSSQLKELQIALATSKELLSQGEDKLNLLGGKVESYLKELSFVNSQLSEKTLKISDLEARIILSDSTIGNLKAENQTMDKQLRDAKTEITLNSEEYTKNLLAKDNTLQSLGKLVEEHKLAEVKQNEFSNELTAQIQSLQSQISEKAEEIASLTGDLKVMETRLASSNEGGAAAGTSAVDSLQEEFKKQMAAIKLDHTDSINRKKAELDVLHVELVKLKEANHELQSSNQILENNLKAESSAKEEHKKHTAQKNLEIEEKVKDIQALKDLHEKEKAELIQKMDEQNREINKSMEIERKCVNLSSDIENLNHKIVELTSQLQSEREKAQNSEVAEGTQRELQAKVVDLQSKLDEEIKSKKNEVEQIQVLMNQQIKVLEESSTTEFAKKIQDVNVEMEKKTAEIATLAKKLDVTKLELENSRKELSKNKETSEYLSKSLQEQIAQIADSKVNSEKKLKADLEEKAKKEKVDLESSFKKEKLEIEEKGRKLMVDNELRNTKERIEVEEKAKKEKIKLNQDLEKLRKDYEVLKADTSKKDELTKALNKMKILEAEVNSAKMDLAQTTEKIADLTKDLEKAKEDQEKLKVVSEELNTLQAKHEIVMQENEVAQASYERNLKGVNEKEEMIKKLKNARDDISASERTLKSTVTRLEKEKELVTSENGHLKAQIETQITLVNAAKESAENEIKNTLNRYKDMESELNMLKNEKEQLSKKLEESDHELSVSGRKAAQMVKDLQKQLAKQRKGGDEDSSINNNNTTAMNPAANSGSAQKHNHNTTTTSDSLSAENEALIKRASMFEEELRSADESLKRVRQELDQKSKVVQQYILRDHAAALQPDEKPKQLKIGINILSSSGAMQKLDPVILSSINMKMQKLLEDLTIQMLTMEDELKKLRGGNGKPNHQ